MRGNGSETIGMKNRPKDSKKGNILHLLLAQILLTLAALAVFDLFHHVLPDRRAQREGMREPIAALGPARPEPAAPDEEKTEPAGEAGLSAEAGPPTLRERSAGYFSEQVQFDENSYTSPNIAITIKKYERPPAFPNMTFFAADIRIADIACFQAAFPASGSYSEAKYIARENAAILGINGDCMESMTQGLLVRNGLLYQQAPGTSDCCVLYGDGSIETLGPDTLSAEEILAREPVHVWQFGPMLLDGDGRALESFNISAPLQEAHPRTALGYYEPGHYCFVVVDGRQRGYSDGATLRELALLMESLGCRAAFNLDGGASSRMIFNGEPVNRPSASRAINDMLIIREPQEVGNETP